MRYEDGVVDSGSRLLVFDEPTAEGNLHVHAFKSRGPRRMRRQSTGRALLLVVVVLLIVIALAIWLSSRVEVSTLGTALTNY
jgi:ABC-type uncharacterized transport system permease subunit